MLDGGKGYAPNESPVVTIPPPRFLNGTRARAVAEVRNGSVTAIRLTEAGRGYLGENESYPITVAPPAGAKGRDERAGEISAAASAELSMEWEVWC